MSTLEEAVTLETLRNENDLLRRRIENAEDRIAANAAADRRIIDFITASEAKLYELMIQLARHLDDHLKHCAGRTPDEKGTPP